MDILFPVGRMIGGSLYKANPRKDNFGKPKLDAEGKPVTGFDFGVAIPKGPEASWAMTTWGAQIKQVGDAAYPGMTGTPSFAWKITDGDSTVPNKKNRRPCDQEGYPGHWVAWFSQSWAPELCDAKGANKLTEPDAIVPGYFVQVFSSVKGNAPSPTPGVYLNPKAVALAGYGQKIEGQGVDTTEVGFGGGPVPVGMSAMPPGAMAQPASVAAPPASVAMPTPPIVPNPAFLAPPPGPTLTAAGIAAGGTYDAFKQAGWNDDQLKASGYLA